MPPPTGVDDGKPLEGVECIELQNECLRGDYAKVKELVDGGADVNETDSVGRTALMIAAKHGESEIARVLMQAGADVRVVTKEMGKPTLMWSMGHNDLHTYIATMMIERGADVNETDKAGWTPLMMAVLSMNIKTVKLLLKHGADKTVTVEEGLVTPAHTAFDLVAHIAKDKRKAIGELLLLEGSKAKWVSWEERWVDPDSPHVAQKLAQGA